MTTAARRWLLRVHASFIGVAGFAGVIFDIRGVLYALGPQGERLCDAHVLARTKDSSYRLLGGGPSAGCSDRRSLFPRGQSRIGEVGDFADCDELWTDRNLPWCRTNGRDTSVTA